MFDRAAISLAASTNTPLSLLDSFGQTKGIVEGRMRKRAGLHIAQARAVLNEGFRLEVARKIVVSRVRNQRSQLFRLNRRQESKFVIDQLLEMKRFLVKIGEARSVDELMGFEGASTARYWPAIGTLADGATSESFKRSRPGKDPLNAAMNYLTGILERDIRASIHTVGLHQGFAFLHASRDDHDGLVFDLMEPFRAPLTEGLCIYLFNSKRLRDEMFRDSSDFGVELDKISRTRLIEGYEAAVAKSVNRPDKQGRLAWRSMMVQQCRSLADAVRTESIDKFYPYLMEA
jgi:CRISPR-associated protein Cas1